MLEHKTDIVVVYDGTLTDAALVKTYLDNEGIPSFLKDELVSRSTFFINDGFHGVKVVVSSENETIAREFIQEFKAVKIIKA